MTDWPVDARVFSRPTSKAREKRPGDEAATTPSQRSAFESRTLFKDFIFAIVYSVFIWRHGGHIAVLKQWNGGLVEFPNQFFGSWTLSYVNAFFCSNKFAYMLVTRVKTLYKLRIYIMRNSNDLLCICFFIPRFKYKKFMFLVAVTWRKTNSN